MSSDSPAGSNVRKGIVIGTPGVIPELSMSAISGTRSASCSPEAGPGPSKGMRREESPASQAEALPITPKEPPQLDVALTFGCPIDYRGVPHIFNSIFDHLVEGFDEDKEGVYRTLLSFRATCKELSERVDAILLQHVVIAGEGPSGVYSRFGRLPFMCPDHLLRGSRSRYKTFTPRHPVRVCDFAGTPVTKWSGDQLKKQFLHAASTMSSAQVFRHRDSFEFEYKHLPFNPTKIVRFTDLTNPNYGVCDGQLWKPPHTVQTLVLHIEYTQAWKSYYQWEWGGVRKIVVIFEPVDGPQGNQGNQYGAHGIVCFVMPITTALFLTDCPDREVTVVDVPQTAANFLFAAANNHDENGENGGNRPLRYLDRLLQAAKQPRKINFLTKKEYVATLTPSEYIEEFCWYAPIQYDVESALHNSAMGQLGQAYGPD